MRKVLQIVATILLLASALSTTSFADGPDQPPMCPSCELGK